MARLHEVSESESDAEFPDLLSLLQNIKLEDHASASREEKMPRTSPKPDPGISKISNYVKSVKTPSNIPRTSVKKQNLDQGDFLRLSYDLPSEIQLQPSKSIKPKRSPQKTTRPIRTKEHLVRKFIKNGYRSYDESEASYDSDTSLSGFIVNDSSSEEESTPEKSAPKSPKQVYGQNAKSIDGKGIAIHDGLLVLQPPKTPRRLITRRERDLLKSTKTAKKMKEPQVVIDLVSPIKPTFAQLSSDCETFEKQRKNVIPGSDPESLEGGDVSQQESSLVKDSSATDSSLLEM